MKLLSKVTQALSLAALASAAPAPTGKTIPNPPDSMKPHAMTLEQIAQLPNPGRDQPASNMTDHAPAGVQILAGCRNTIMMRWATVSSAQRTAYANAFKCLMNTPPRGIFAGSKSLYHDMVFVHNNMVNQVHGCDIFLPWHRYYLYMLRSFMASQCNFHGPYPWWKETNNAGDFGASDIFSPQWFGALPPAPSNGGGYCISQGLFAGIMNPISGDCVARGENFQDSTDDSVANENNINNIGDYPTMRQNLELSNHAYGHLAVGPTMMSQSQSPSDPTFFLHHSYVDYVWKRWQNQQSWRWSSINGCADKQSPCTPLTVNTQLTSMGLFQTMTVGQVLDSEGDALCYTYDLLQ